MDADLSERDFTATEHNQRWVADIVEFPTGEGKLCLAGIRNPYHRGIVGWDTSAVQHTALVVSALTMALARTSHLCGSVWFETRGEAHAYLFEFIELLYNRQRRQAGLGSPQPSTLTNGVTNKDTICHNKVRETGSPSPPSGGPHTRS